MAANTGQEALVPPMMVGAPLLKMTMLSPTAETSGYPRPVRLSIIVRSVCESAQ
jgi:hypothetical protein